MNRNLTNCIYPHGPAIDPDRNHTNTILDASPRPDHLRCRECGAPARFILVNRDRMPIPHPADGAGQGYCALHAESRGRRAQCAHCQHTRIRFEGYEDLRPTYPVAHLDKNDNCGGH